MSPTDHLLWAVTEIPGCNSICQTRALGLWWGSPPKELVQITCLSTLIDRFASTMSASSMLQFQVHIGSFTSILSLSNSNFILMPDWNLSSFSLFVAFLVELWAVLATRQLMLYLGLSVPAEFCWWVTSLHWTEYVWSSCGQCLKGHQVCERWTEPDYQWCTNFTGSRAPVQISMGLSCTSSIWKMTDALLQTGTPVQNDLNEFYAMIDFANPSLLGPLAAFKRLYADPIQRSRDRDARWDFHLESIQETFPLCLYVVNLPASCVLFAWVWEGDLSEGSVFKVYLKHHIWTSSLMYIWRHYSVMCTSVKRSKKWAMQGPWSCRQELAFAYCGGQQTSTRNTCQPNQSTFHNVETCSWTYSIHLYCSRVQAQSIY